MISRRREEHLRLVLQPPERFRVNDAIAIALKGRTDRVLGFFADASLAVGALRRLRRENLPLALFELFANGGGHAHNIISRRKLVPLARSPTAKFSASVWPRSANVDRVPMSAPAT